MKFEGLRMSKDGNVAVLYLRVDDIVNTMKGLGENI
jgi:hypothetical protein